jgi:hypothetical protein
MFVKDVVPKEMVVRDGSIEPLRWEETRVLGKRKTIGFVGSVGWGLIGSQGNGKPGR